MSGKGRAAKPCSNEQLFTSMHSLLQRVPSSTLCRLMCDEFSVSEPLLCCVVADAQHYNLWAKCGASQLQVELQRSMILILGFVQIA